MFKSSLGLSHLLQLDRQLRQDQNQSLRQLQERDRSIGTSLKERSAQARLLAWLAAVTGDKLQRPLLESLLPVSLAALGLLTGIMTMAGLLLVDQQRPVNVLVFLAVFVGLQWLLLLVTLAAGLLLTLRGEGTAPSAHLNIIHWLVQRSYRRLNEKLRPDQFSPLLRWLMLSLGQLFGLCFNLGALLAFLLILLVVDRSFGWSSTLDISASALHHLLQALATPWSWFWPAANVNLELIETTRYQSLQVEFGAEQVRAMRAWWPFLGACIVVYGLLPRLLLWIVFHWVYRRRLRLTFINYPGASLVLGRMDAPLVHTQATGHERAAAVDDSKVLRRMLPDGQHNLVDWSGALASLSETERSDWERSGQPLHSAGVHLEEDAAIMQHINQQSDDVVVFVKSWEPPLSELGDFLQGIRPNLNCYLYLLPLPGQSIKPEALNDWQHFARQGHHPRLLVVASDDEEARP